VRSSPKIGVAVVTSEQLGFLFQSQITSFIPKAEADFGEGALKLDRIL